MGMTGTADGTDYGTTTGQTQLEIVNSSHPIANGLSGGQTVQTSQEDFKWGVPGTGASKVAEIMGSNTRSGIFTYDDGSTLYDGTTAAARRAFLWFAANTFDTANSTGQGLFDRTFEWAMTGSAPNRVFPHWESHFFT